MFGLFGKYETDQGFYLEEFLCVSEQESTLVAEVNRRIFNDKLQHAASDMYSGLMDVLTKNEPFNEKEPDRPKPIITPRTGEDHRRWVEVLTAWARVCEGITARKHEHNGRLQEAAEEAVMHALGIKPEWYYHSQYVGYSIQEVKVL